MDEEIKHRNPPIKNKPTESSLRPRVMNIARDISAQPDGKYVITLTLRGETAFYTLSPMSEVKH